MNEPVPQPVLIDSTVSAKIIAALNLRGFGVEHVSIEIHPQELVRAVISVYLTREQVAAILTPLAEDQRNNR